MGLAEVNSAAFVGVAYVSFSTPLTTCFRLGSLTVPLPHSRKAGWPRAQHIRGSGQLIEENDDGLSIADESLKSNTRAGGAVS